MDTHTTDAAQNPNAKGAQQLLEYWRGIRKRKLLITLIALACCGLAYAWTLKQARIYEADCSLQYDPNPPKPLGHEVEDVASPMMYWETREYFATQNKIIASRSVAERVVHKLSLQESADFWEVPPEERNTWKRASIPDTAKRLQKVTTVTPERDTRIVHVRVKDRSAQRAALLANTIADAYIERTMEERLGATTGALEWLGKQLDSLKRQLGQSELSLHEFSEKNTNLAVSLEDQQNIVASTIQEISHQLTETQTKRIEVEAALDGLRASNVDDPLLVHANQIMMNSAVTQLRQSYRQLLTQRDALAVNYGEGHPKIVAINEQLATTKREMRGEIDGLIAGSESELTQVTQIEKGMRAALDRANRLGIELNLQEITYRGLQRERDNTAKLYGTLLERTAQTDLTRALQIAFVRVVDDALVPNLPSWPRVNVALAIGGFLGLFLGIAVALTLEQLDRTVRGVEEAERLGVTILGVMPHIDDANQLQTVVYGRRKRRQAAAQLTNRDLVVHTHPKSTVAECCRTIRTNLTFMSTDMPRKAVVITSAGPREGKTTVAMSLAISLAQSGKRVLIVDTDLRKPRLHRALGIALSKGGITSVLVGEHTLKEAIHETVVPNLFLLAAGPIPPNPSELLHTTQFRQLLDDMRPMFDQIIFDSPPLAAVTDAAIIAPQVDGVILVIHSERTTRDALRTALRQIRDVRSQLTGGVLNEVDLSGHAYGYSSYYYYHNEGYYETKPGGDDDGHDGKPPSRPVAQA